MPRKKLDPWFKAEADAVQEIDNARSSSNWEALGVQIDCLLQARQERSKHARNGRGVRVIQSSEDVDSVKDGGRYLVQPPLVARDAAILDGAMKTRGFSGMVACREPVTNLGFCPIVALGSGVTVRVRVEEPKNPLKPTCDWFDNATNELGKHVLEQLDTETTDQRQLDYLLAHLSAIPMHVPTYRAAIRLCNTLLSKSV